MAEDKPRLTRLTAILTQLQSKRLVTARDIAEKHKVSIRTVYRDIRTLEQSGIPIVTEEGKGYSIMQGYHLPPVMFTEEEANAMLIAEQLILKNKDQSLIKYYTDAVTKIKSVLRSGQQSKTEFLADRIQVRNNYENEKTSNYLIQLQSCIANFQLVKLYYSTAEGRESERFIEPFAVYTTQGNWILIAFCRNKQDFRAFRLDRIQRLQLSDERFTPHEITLEAYLESCRKNWPDTPDTPLSSTQNTFVSNQNNQKMQSVNIEPFQLIGIAVRTSNANGQAASEIAGLWQTFLVEQVLQKIPNRVDDTVYSLYTEYEGDHNHPYTAMLGCKVTDLSDIPEGMQGKSFTGGKYVQLSARGDLMQGLVVKQWMDIWEMDLDRAYTADFEVFGEKAQNPKDAEVDFLIAIK